MPLQPLLGALGAQAAVGADVGLEVVAVERQPLDDDLRVDELEERVVQAVLADPGVLTQGEHRHVPAGGPQAERRGESAESRADHDRTSRHSSSSSGPNAPVPT